MPAAARRTDGFRRLIVLGAAALVLLLTNAPASAAGDPSDPSNPAAFTADRQQGDAPLKVEFTITYEGPYSDCYSYEWFFHDPFDQSGDTGKDATHTFTREGTYDVVVHARFDYEDCSSTDEPRRIEPASHEEEFCDHSESNCVSASRTITVTRAATPGPTTAPTKEPADNDDSDDKFITTTAVTTTTVATTTTAPPASPSHGTSRR